MGMESAPVIHSGRPVPPEDVELLRRRTSAVLLQVFGIIMLVAFLPVGIYFGIRSWESGLTVGILLLIVGSILSGYGGYLYRKYQHVMWTKQAIREYDQQRMHARMDAAEAYRMAREATSHPVVDTGGTRHQATPPVEPANQPGRPAAPVSSARFVLPDGNEIALSGSDRWFGRDDFRQYLTPDNVSFLSRRHIMVSCANSRFYIEDPESTNGTRLNRSEINGKGKYELRDGDVIDLADVVQLLFKLP